MKKITKDCRLRLIEDIATVKKEDSLILINYLYEYESSSLVINDLLKKEGRVELWMVKKSNDDDEGEEMADSTDLLELNRDHATQLRDYLNKCLSNEQT